MTTPKPHRYTPYFVAMKNHVKDYTSTYANLIQYLEVQTEYNT
jgi:hypothetical protein